MPQNIIVCIEPSDFKWMDPFKIGYMYMNRFAIDEEAAFEIIDVVILPRSSRFVGSPRYFDRNPDVNVETEKGLFRAAFRKITNDGAVPLKTHLFLCISVFEITESYEKTA